MKNLTSIIISVILLSSLNLAYAEEVSSVTYFASNNTGVIQPSVAYTRLLSEPQDNLKSSMIDIMQANHMQQSQCADSLGMYQMAETGSMTADNTKVFTTSPYQTFSDAKAFEIAKEMADTLQQESVAVFIPNAQAYTGDTVVQLKSHPYTIHEAMQMINEKLPAEYSKAYSLHFNNKMSSYNKITVSNIEWLGGKVNPNIIQTAFPNEQVSSKHGKAYLVYQNGTVEEI